MVYVNSISVVDLKINKLSSKGFSSSNKVNFSIIFFLTFDNLLSSTMQINLSDTTSTIFSLNRAPPPPKIKKKINRINIMSSFKECKWKPERSRRTLRWNEQRRTREVGQGLYPGLRACF